VVQILRPPRLKKGAQDLFLCGTGPGSVIVSYYQSPYLESVR
jgi:hypothetical protein